MTAFYLKTGICTQHISRRHTSSIHSLWTDCSGFLNLKEDSHYSLPNAKSILKARKPFFSSVYEKSSERYIPNNLERVVFLMKIGIHWIMITVIIIALWERESIITVASSFCKIYLLIILFGNIFSPKWLAGNLKKWDLPSVVSDFIQNWIARIIVLPCTDTMRQLNMWSNNQTEQSPVQDTVQVVFISQSLPLLNRNTTETRQNCVSNS